MCESVKTVLPRIVSGLIFTTCFTIAHASGCTQHWENPSSQRVEMRGMVLALDEYANKERHFSIKQASHVLDIYFLEHALLVKGPLKSEIEQYSEDELDWFPMALALPNAVLSSVSTKPPCTTRDKIRFSQPLDGKLGFGAHKLTQVNGEIALTGTGLVNYKFTATVTPPLEGQNSIVYNGSLRLSRTRKPLAASTNITGYTLIGVTHPLPVVGEAPLHLSTVGELRALLAREESMDQDENDDDEGFKF
jgi:hypothetical protein